jgi:hypothetical protein
MLQLMIKGNIDSIIDLLCFNCTLLVAGEVRGGLVRESARKSVLVLLVMDRSALFSLSSAGIGTALIPDVDMSLARFIIR